MTEESAFKKEFIQMLNRQSDGWVDGDKEPGHGKKVDIINRRLSIAIEVKDDNHYKIIADSIPRTTITNLKLMNQRYSDHINSANGKFKNYPGFKTIVLFRTEYIPQTVRYAIEGLDQYKRSNDGLSYVGKVGKYTQFGKNEVGGYLIFTGSMYYFPNYLAKSERVISKEEVEILVGKKLIDDETVA